MLQENGADNLNENHLFHGTSRKVVDAICTSNFDFRICGLHGTVYGEGMDTDTFYFPNSINKYKLCIYTHM